VFEVMSLESGQELFVRNADGIYFIHKTNNIHFNRDMVNVLMLGNTFVRDLGLILKSKLYFH
jgi:hypothetical protein